MSRVAEPIEVEFPESDGEPIGETDLHRRWTKPLDETRPRNEEQGEP